MAEAKSGDIADDEATIIAPIANSNENQLQIDYEEYQMLRRKNILQLEVDLITKDDESENYKSAVWSLGATFYRTLVLDKMSPADRKFLLSVVHDYRKEKKEQLMKIWVKDSAKTTRIQNEKQSYPRKEQAQARNSKDSEGW